MSGALQRKLRHFAIGFLICTAFGLYFFSQGIAQKLLSGDPTPWWHHLVSWLTGAYISGALTPAVLWLGRRFPFKRQHWLRTAALHLLFSFLFATAQWLWESEVLFHAHVFPSIMKTLPATLLFLLLIGFHQWVFSYWLLLGAQYSLRYYRQYREREQQAVRLELHSAELKTQLARAHLSTLKMQLQPHFLFNTLNAIVVLVRQGNTQQAEEMLARLSDLLRRVLIDVETQEIPLRSELEYLRLYLSIEQVRFQDRLKVEISADPAVLDAAFPHMGLQPIVENAIRHGIGRSSTAGRIWINATHLGNALQVTVEDDGPGLPPNYNAFMSGIGLANTRTRFNQLYGEAGQLRLTNRNPSGVTVTVSLPFRLASDLSGIELLEVHAFQDLDR